MVGFIVFHISKVGKSNNIRFKFPSYPVCLSAAVALRNWVEHIKFYYSFGSESGQ